MNIKIPSLNQFGNYGLKSTRDRLERQAKMVQSDMKGDLEASNSYFPDKYKRIDYRI